MSQPVFRTCTCYPPEYDPSPLHWYCAAAAVSFTHGAYILYAWLYQFCTHLITSLHFSLESGTWSAWPIALRNRTHQPISYEQQPPDRWYWSLRDLKGSKCSIYHGMGIMPAPQSPLGSWPTIQQFPSGSTSPLPGSTSFAYTLSPPSSFVHCVHLVAQ